MYRERQAYTNIEHLCTDIQYNNLHQQILDNHDISTYNAYFHKKMLENKLTSLIEIEKKICEQEEIKNNFKQIKNESSTQSNLGEQK